MSRQRHILVVEDEQHLAIGIKFNLEREGCLVTAVPDGPTALRAIDEAEPPIDAVILDLMLPGMSGYDVCEAIRHRPEYLPVLILSARTLAEDRARGFDVGADQYMMKPFDLDELLSRVKNLLQLAPRRSRRASEAPVAAVAIGDAMVDFESYEARRGEEVHRLTPLLAKLLQYFVAHPGRVIPREELLREVWELPPRVHTRAPDQFMRRLRILFERDPAQPRHFLTIRDTGYRFVADPDEEAR